ncbi:MAG: ParB/RepB/Spo0J family partition protein, partial [Oscillospiraceae bacterium]
MADEKQTMTTEEHTTPEVSGPAPDQPTVETITAEQLHNPANNVIPFGGAGADLPTPGEEDIREPWEKTQDELDAENKKPRRGRPPKEAAEQTGPEGDKKPEGKATRKGRPPKADKAAPDKAEKPVRDKVSQSKKAPAKAAPDKVAPPAPVPEQPPDPANIPRPVEQGQVVYLKLSELHSFHTFRDHPYKVQDDDKMKELVGTIQEHGVMTPATVRPEKEGGGYELIAGHRRRHGSELAGLEEMPCIVREMTDLEAVREMKISNKQRGDPLPSELAKLFDLEVEAIKHQGGRLDGVAEG